MKKICSLLFVLLTLAAFPAHAGEPAPAAAGANAGSTYLPDNYQFTVTVDRPNKESIVISFLSGGRDTEVTNITFSDPMPAIGVKAALKENGHMLVDYRVIFRVRIDGDKFIDEGIKGSVHLPMDREVTLLKEPGRTIRMKVSLPGKL